MSTESNVCSGCGSAKRRFCGCDTCGLGKLVFMAPLRSVSVAEGQAPIPAVDHLLKSELGRRVRPQRKVAYALCRHCGVNWIQGQLHRSNCPQRHVSRLPEWEKLQRRDDVFDTGLVVSGGGFGVGKGKRK